MAFVILDNMDQSPFSPLTLFRSFMTVISSFVLAQMIHFGIALLLGYLLFPEFLAVLKLDSGEQSKLAAENYAAVIPFKMFLLQLVLGCVCYWIIGYLAASFAPIGHFQHGLFVAILLFAWFLQWFAAAPAEGGRKTRDFVFMWVLPVAVIMGARTASSAFIPESGEPGDTYEAGE